MSPLPQRGTEANNVRSGTLTRHTAGTDGARPEHGAPVCRKFGLLMPTGTAVYLADAGDLGSEDGHEPTRETTRQDRRETEEGAETRQRTLPARGMRGANDERRRTTEWLS